MSMFKYQEFVQAVKNDGLAKQNRFYVQITPPLIGGQTGINFSAAGSKMRNLHMFCKSVSVPGVNVASNPTRYTGENFESPNDRNFGDMTLTFYVDRQLYTRMFFDDWVNTIQNQQTKVFNYYSDFISDSVTIFVLDKMDHENYFITLAEAWPKSIGTLSLDQGSNDTMLLDVTLTYKYYTSGIIEHDEQEGAKPEISPYDYWKQFQQKDVKFIKPELSPLTKWKQGTVQPGDPLAAYQNDFVSFQNEINSLGGVANGVDTGALLPLSAVTSPFPNITGALAPAASGLQDAYSVVSNIQQTASTITNGIVAPVDNIKQIVTKQFPKILDF